MNMEKRVAFITGSSRGIGKSIALSFAETGIVPIITGRNESTILQVVEEINEGKGAAAAGYAFDVTDLKECTRVIKEVLSRFGKIDYLINNAGITRDNLFVLMKESEWDEVININLKGTFNCTRAAIKSMVRNRFGRIVNITSLVGVSGNAAQANYSASKAGIIGFTKSLAKEYAARGITVNAVAPGYIDTDMTVGLSDKLKAVVLNNIPMGRFGSGDDISNCVRFLISDNAGYITGQTIHVNGGMLMI